MQPQSLVNKPMTYDVARKHQRNLRWMGTTLMALGVVGLILGVELLGQALIG